MPQSRKTPTLPKNDEQACRVIEHHARREEANNSWRMTKWAIAEAYLNGAREFKLMSEGKVKRFWLTKDKKLPMQVTSLLAKVNQAAGIMKSMDFSPLVRRTGTSSLAGIRDRASSQVILDSIVDADAREKVVDLAVHYQVYLGCVGILANTVQTGLGDLSSDFCVIHPKELLPYPSIGEDLTQQQGILWQRWVPIEDVEAKYNKGKKFTEKQRLKLDVIAKPFGEIPRSPNENSAESAGGTVPMLNPQTLANGPTDDTKNVQHLVKLRTLWIQGEGNSLLEFAVCSGLKMFERKEYATGVHQVPIGIARFYDNGSFHGAGMYDLLYTLERQFEQMVRDVAKNVRELDQYGFLVIPGGEYNTNTAFSDAGGRGLKVVQVNPRADFTGSGMQRPFQVAPHNTGDMPARVADIINGVIDQVSPVTDIIQDKGRVDSLPGLQFLDEERKRPLVTPVASLQRAFGTVYRSLALQANASLMAGRGSLPVRDLKVEMAGVKIDFDNDTAMFGSTAQAQNIVPRVSRLEYTIASRGPGSDVIRRQELMSLWQGQLISWEQFVITLLSENIESPVWIDAERNAYASVVRNILRLYNDGETHGEIENNLHFQRSNIQLMVLDAFMGGPVMAAASAEVKEQFINWRESMLQNDGMILPESVPDPMETALLQEAQAGALQQIQAAQAAQIPVQ